MLYTLTNSLTGAGVGKYILPGLGLVVALVGIFAALAWVLRRRRHRPHHHATACWRCAWRWPPWMPAPHSIKLPSW
ncbi:Phosphoglycerol transferase I [Enterobacter hormaechei]|nr:Phosphoglycerol transferase I [Enterobacter hormaechei]